MGEMKKEEKKTERKRAGKYKKKKEPRMGEQAKKKVETDQAVEVGVEKTEKKVASDG